MTEVIAVRVATLRALVFGHCPRVTVTVGILCSAAILDGVVGQTSPAEQCLTLSADMRRQLAFIGHSSLTSPLCFVDALPYGVLAEVLVERLTKADTCTFFYTLFYAGVFIDFRHLQWLVFIRCLSLRPEEVPICLDEPFLVVNGFCKHVGLVFAIDSLAPVLGQLVVAQVNVLRIIRFDEGLITTAFVKARETLL